MFCLVFFASCNGKLIILIFYFLLFLSHLILSVTVVFLYVSYPHDVFRDGWYLHMYNLLNISHSENMWSRSCVKKNVQCTRSFRLLRSLRTYQNCYSVVPFPNLLAIHFVCGRISVILSAYMFWSYKKEIFCFNGLNVFYLRCTFCLWALCLIAVLWNICLMQLWNSWRTCQCLGSRFEM